MLCFPNAKINIGLFITEKRTDGYHNLETVFAPVSLPRASMQANMLLHDVLEIVPAGETQLHLSGMGVAGPQSDNLVLKAWNLFQERFPDLQPVDIFLQKNIPMGAGLGGGSADGAFMLRLLNDFYALQLPDAELAAMALHLGSDCPFFIYNKPCFAKGRGELLEPLSESLPPCSLFIVCSNIHVSTAQAFAMIQPHQPGFDLRLLPTLPIEQWKDHIVNDFEGPVFRMHPELAAIKDALYAAGARYASMTGSGSALYGIFPKGHQPSVVLQGCRTFFIP